MLNFSIKIPKKQLHQSFQIVKILTYLHSELVLIKAHCSLNCKNKKKSFLFSCGEVVGWLFMLSCFIIILMSSLYYLNKMVKNIKILMFDVF